jgi:hypothetical protein
VLRDDFRPDSDIDVLVAFSPDARWTLFNHVDMQDELEVILSVRLIWLANEELSAAVIIFAGKPFLARRKLFMLHRDLSSLADILVASRLVQMFVVGADRDTFETDLMRQSAVMRQLEIMGSN